jgi:hypothetical protein
MILFGRRRFRVTSTQQQSNDLKWSDHVIKKWLCLTVVLGGLIGSSANAQDTLLDHLISACEGDIDKYCSQVTPGEGRILHCMAAYEDQISGQCDYAFYRAATLLEQLSMAISYLAESCAADIETFCSDVEMGEGKILACLESNEKEVSDGCKKAVADTVAD